MSERARVLFLCTGNSCRSQMAEGLTNNLRSERFEASSAGTRPQSLNPFAVKVMAEAGIDISRNRSKNVTELLDQRFDLIVTVCDDAQRDCPLWLGKGTVLHHPFDDPPRLSANLKDENQILAIYRRVRDEIRTFVLSLSAGSQS